MGLDEIHPQSITRNLDAGTHLPIAAALGYGPTPSGRKPSNRIAGKPAIATEIVDALTGLMVQICYWHFYSAKIQKFKIRRRGVSLALRRGLGKLRNGPGLQV